MSVKNRAGRARLKKLHERYKNEGYIDSSFTAAVRRLMFEKKLYIKDIADKCNISFSAAQSYTSGRHMPAAYVIFLMETLFEVSHGYLFYLAAGDLCNGRYPDTRYLRNRERQ